MPKPDLHWHKNFDPMVLQVKTMLLEAQAELNQPHGQDMAVATKKGWAEAKQGRTPTEATKDHFSHDHFSQATQPPLTPRQGSEYRGRVPDANP